MSKVPASDPEPSGLNIGLVAGDDTLRSAVRLLLQVYGFHVREYRSAGEYLAMTSQPNHCLVVDCSLRDMSSRRLCERVVWMEATPPVVAVTASPEDFEPPYAVLPMVRVIRKPFDGRLLIEAIRTALRTAGGVEVVPSPEVVNAGT